MLRGKIRPGEGEEYFIPGDRGRSPGKELMEQRLGGSEGEPWMAFGKACQAQGTASATVLRGQCTRRVPGGRGVP